MKIFKTYDDEIQLLQDRIDYLIELRDVIKDAEDIDEIVKVVDNYSDATNFEVMLRGLGRIHGVVF